ncbi:hypothetical protein SDC9_82891 [bioreactor metagenome]|uniref:Uncharacterized protein n=1 Tax=bioreactor metagenome TaxID=1076179 RepID=A0A644Z601_9ZZZZ
MNNMKEVDRILWDISRKDGLKSSRQRFNKNRRNEFLLLKKNNMIDGFGHTTETLVKNYCKLSAHCENLPEQIGIIYQEIDVEFLEHTDLNLKGEMKFKQKTKMNMDYVDAILLA